MNNVIKSMSLITLCATLGLPLGGYAKCQTTLDLTLVNNSSHDLTLTSTSQECSCAQNANSMSSLYHTGDVLPAKGGKWHGNIFVDTSSGDCWISKTTYEGHFSDADHKDSIISYYFEESGGSVSDYDKLTTENYGGDTYTTITNENPSGSGCADHDAQSTCTLTAEIKDK